MIEDNLNLMKINKELIDKDNDIQQKFVSLITEGKNKDEEYSLSMM